MLFTVRSSDIDIKVIAEKRQYEEFLSRFGVPNVKVHQSSTGEGCIPPPQTSQGYGPENITEKGD